MTSTPKSRFPMRLVRTFLCTINLIHLSFDPIALPHVRYIGTQALVHPTDYLTVNVSQMEAEYDNKEWDADDLLKKVLEYTDDFFHGSHTLVHLNRDELQQSDCNIEDGGKRQFFLCSTTVGTNLLRNHGHARPSARLMDSVCINFQYGGELVPFHLSLIWSCACILPCWCPPCRAHLLTAQPTYRSL